MLTSETAREIVLDLFEEEALIIGGLAAIHELEDDLVWRLMQNLDVLLGKTLERLQDRDQPSNPNGNTKPPNIKPHPAIEEFLAKLRRS